MSRLVIGVLTFNFHLPGCRSLKEKRGRLGYLRDRFGKSTQVAVCESDFADSHQRAEWSFVVAGGDRATVSQILDKLERDVPTSVDAVVIGCERDLS